MTPHRKTLKLTPLICQTYVTSKKICVAWQFVTNVCAAILSQALLQSVILSNHRFIHTKAAGCQTVKNPKKNTGPYALKHQKTTIQTSIAFRHFSFPQHQFMR